MASNEIKIVITARDEASKVLAALGGNVEQLSRASAQSTPITAKLSQNWAAIAGITASAGIGVHALVGEVDSSITSANRLQSALTGLNSVARAFGQDTVKARQAAQSLAKDGLMNVAQAATGLKNLLASGFSLDQAIVLMNRFKDSAAFNRQAALSFGDAVSSATEGIKNGNSILVDNAGVTKNLSVILQEAGFSAQDLMKATSDSTIRQALYNGIIKETRAQVGDAARLADQYAGSQAKLGAATETLRQQLGIIFQTALLPIITAVTPFVSKLAEWAGQHQKLTAVIIASMAVFLGLVTILGLIGGALALLAPLVAAFGAVTVALVPVIVAVFAGAAVAIVTDWDRVKEFITKVLPGAIAAVPWFGVFQGIAEGAYLVFERVKAAALGALNYIRNLDWGGGLAAVGKQIGNSIIGMIERSLKDALSGLPGGVANKIHLPRFETGVRNFSGGLAVVGDVNGRGGEIIDLPRGSNVFSNAESKQMLQPGGVQVYQTNNIYNQADLTAANRELGWRLAMRAA